MTPGNMTPEIWPLKMTPLNMTSRSMTTFNVTSLNKNFWKMTPKIRPLLIWLSKYDFLRYDTWNDQKWWWDMKNENRTLNGTLLKGINSTVKNKFVTRHKQKYEYIVSRKRESNCGQSSWNQVSLKIISKKFQKFVKSSIKFEREILCEKFRKISRFNLIMP